MEWPKGLLEFSFLCIIRNCIPEIKNRTWNIHFPLLSFLFHHTVIVDCFNCKMSRFVLWKKIGRLAFLFYLVMFHITRGVLRGAQKFKMVSGSAGLKFIPFFTYFAPSWLFKLLLHTLLPNISCMCDNWLYFISVIEHQSSMIYLYYIMYLYISQTLLQTCTVVWESWMNILPYHLRKAQYFQTCFKLS